MLPARFRDYAPGGGRGSSERPPEGTAMPIEPELDEDRA
jgi:hypothetical protein